MAATQKNWSDNNPPQADDVDLNGFKEENNRLISSSGQGLNTADNDQTTKAVAIYASGGADYYTDSGTANAYVLTITGSKKTPPAYFDGMRIRFVPANTNTGASTVNAGGLGLANLKDSQGNALTTGALPGGIVVDATYNSSNSEFRLSQLVSGFYRISPQKNIFPVGNFGTNPWQRGTSFTSVSDNSYIADRIRYNKTGTMVHDISKSSTVHAVSLSGYFSTNSLMMNVTTAQSSPASADDLCKASLIIEGFDFSHIAQRPFILYFVAYATTTGKYCLSLRNLGNDRSYVTEIEISQSNTWQEFIIPIAASPSAGTWEYTNDVGLEISLHQFKNDSGTFTTATTNQWLTGNYQITSNQVNNCGSVGNKFGLNLIKIEPNQIFTGFQEPTFNEILAYCQRYFEKTYKLDVAPGTPSSIDSDNRYFATTSTHISHVEYFKTNKRISQSITVAYNPSNGSQGSWQSDGVDKTVSGIVATQKHISAQLSGTVTASAMVNGHWTIDADFY